jgi:hypothetical protein
VLGVAVEEEGDNDEEEELSELVKGAALATGSPRFKPWRTMRVDVMICTGGASPCTLSTHLKQHSCSLLQSCLDA